MTWFPSFSFLCFNGTLGPSRMPVSAFRSGKTRQETLEFFKVVLVEPFVSSPLFWLLNVIHVLFDDVR